MIDRARPVAASRAGRLLGTPAARELVPSVPGQSARWHIHDYPGPYCRWNYHPEFEVHLIRCGNGRFIVGDCIDTFSAGQLTLIGSNLPHHWISDLDPAESIAGRDVVFQFHPSWIAACQQSMPELAAIDPLLRRASRGLEFDADTARAGARQLLAIGESSGLDRLAAIIALLTTLVQAQPERTRTLATAWAPRHHEARAADIIDQVMGYIAGPAGDVSMAGAAAMVGMSESTFSRYFTRTAGQSFSDTVRKMRMAQACRFLTSSDLSVATIAQRVGYRNLSNFNRQFHRIHGQTPSAYRRQARNASEGDQTERHKTADSTDS